MGTNFTSPFLADFDKDGSVDILFYNQGTRNLWVLFNKVPSKEISYDGNLCYNPVVREEIMEQKGNLMFVHINSLDDIKGKNAATT